MREGRVERETWACVRRRHEKIEFVSPPFGFLLCELASDEALDEFLYREVSTSQHISCTCKMGPESDPMAVVSQYGKVHGLEGLRVVDASIMPDCIRANTNVTTMMIGERVAEWIKQGK